MITAVRKGPEIIVTGAPDWPEAEEAARPLLQPGEELDEQNARINLETDVCYFTPIRKA